MGREADSKEPGRATLPTAVATAVAPYRQLNENSQLPEVRDAAHAVVAELHEIANDAGRGCVERFHAHALISQIVGRHTDRTDTEQIGEVLLHLAEAIDIGSICTGVPAKSLDIARSNQGTWMSQVAEQLNPEDVKRTTASSERSLRAAYANSDVDTRTGVIRACNLASHLLARGEPTNCSEALSLLEAQAGRSHLLGAQVEGDYFRQIGNAHRRVANGASSDGAADISRQTALTFYRKAENLLAAGEHTTLYADIAVLMFESDEEIEEVIAVATNGLGRIAPGDPYEREAMLQLAEFHLKRYERDHHPADADHAENLSFTAVNSYYTRPGSFEQQGHLRRRLAVLESTANRTGNRLDRYEEMLEIAHRTDHEMTDGLASLSRSAASARSLVGYSRGEVALKDLVKLLSDNLHHERFIGAGSDRGARIAEAVAHVADAVDRVQFARGPLSELSSLIDDAHSAAGQAAVELDTDRPNDEFYIAQSRGHLALMQACAFRNSETMGQANDLLAHAVHVGMQRNLSPSHMLPVLSIARKAAFFVGDRGSAERNCQDLIDTITVFDADMAVNGTPESVVLRERLVAPEVGAIALGGETAQEVAWRIARLRDTQSDLSKADWVRATSETSTRATVVFVAQTMTETKAVIVANRRWTSVDVPGGGAEQLAPVVRQAARASIEGASVAEREVLLDNIMSATKGVLGELFSQLPGGQPVLLVDTGIMHWLPVAGAMLELRPTIPGAMSIDRPTTSSFLEDVELDATSVLVAAGVEMQGGAAYLPKALEDADYIQRAIPKTQVRIDPDLKTARDAIEESSLLFFIAHGEASIRSPLDSRLNLGEPFTARDAHELAGKTPTLAVLASCESFGFDADVAEARFGLGTAMLRQGTDAVIDCTWRVKDEVASEFTVALAKALTTGIGIVAAHGVAIRAVQRAPQHFQLRAAGLPANGL